MMVIIMMMVMMVEAMMMITTIQFFLLQNELREMMEKHSINEALVQEIDRLREENRRLKTKY